MRLASQFRHAGGWLPVAALLITGAAGAAAALQPQGCAVWLIEENDEFGGSDRHYTQGARLNLLLPEGAVWPGLSNLLFCLPAWGFADHLSRLGFALGQTIYTPEDLRAENPPLADRPYAAWLHGVVGLQRRGVTRAGTPVLESWQFELGVIGPAAPGEQSQQFAHRALFSGAPPNGWDTQLGNEVAFNLKHARAVRYRLSRGEHFLAECIPAAGASLGTVDTSLRAGGMLRLGWNVPDDFGPQRVDALMLGTHGRSRGAARALHVSLMAGLEGRLVVRNAFLDGNLFRDSRSVDREPLVGEGFVGTAVGRGGWECGFADVLRTREFETQRESHAYGSLFVRGHF